MTTLVGETEGELRLDSSIFVTRRRGVRLCDGDGYEGTGGGIPIMGCCWGGGMTIIGCPGVVGGGDTT